MKLIQRLFLLLAAGLFALSLANWLGTVPDIRREPESAASASPEEEGYLVHSEGDRVCVRPLSGGRPGYVEGVRVSDLPEEDRRQLAAGLSLPDEASLMALLEDYTG